MVIMISYRLFILNSIFLFFTASVLLRVLQKNIVSILDFGILFLTLSIGFLLNKLIVFNNNITKQSIYYLIFLVYILFNIVFFSFYRVFELKIDFFDIFLTNIFEFKVWIISFFLFMIYFLLKDIDKNKFEIFIILLLKIGLVYTFIEQFISLFGGRVLFETIYSRAGIVTENLLGLKSLGLYRIWGVIGSTQLLGIYHLILVSYYMFGKRTSNFWYYRCCFKYIKNCLCNFIVNVVDISYSKKKVFFTIYDYNTFIIWYCIFNNSFR